MGSHGAVHHVKTGAHRARGASSSFFRGVRDPAEGVHVRHEVGNPGAAIVWLRCLFEVACLAVEPIIETRKDS